MFPEYILDVSERCIYNGVCEVSIYVNENFAGKGKGYKLMKKLTRKAECSNIWTLQAGIFPENLASIRLHAKNGFRIVGTRERIGRMNNMLRHVALMERRSNKIGIS